VPQVPGSFRSRREAPPSAEGRWSLVESRIGKPASDTAFAKATAEQLLSRYGVVTREVALSESVPGGFGAIYPVFKALEEGGRIRRGLFVSGVGALQFVSPAAVELLRSLRDDPESPEIVSLCAADPANAFGTLLPWPGRQSGGEHERGPSRSIGAHLVLVNGALAAYLGRGGRQAFSFLPSDEPERSRAAKAIAAQFAQIAARSRSGFELEEIDGAPARTHPLSSFLVEAGFTAGPRSFVWLQH
jgi:ATP-dependent Lhr-like helicase